MGSAGMDEGQALVAALVVLATPVIGVTDAAKARARSRALTPIYHASIGFRSKSADHEDAAQRLFLRWNRTGVRLEKRTPAQARSLLFTSLENMLIEVLRAGRRRPTVSLGAGGVPEPYDPHTGPVPGSVDHDERYAQSADAVLAARERLRDEAFAQLRDVVLPQCLEGKRSAADESVQVFEERVAVVLGQASPRAQARAFVEAVQPPPDPEKIERRVGARRRALNRLVTRVIAFLEAANDPSLLPSARGVQLLRRRQEDRECGLAEADGPALDAVKGAPKGGQPT